MADQLDSAILRLLRGESDGTTNQLPTPDPVFLLQLEEDADDDDGDAVDANIWQSQPKELHLNTEELICALSTLDPLPSGVNLLCLRVPGLKEEVERSQSIVAQLTTFLQVSAHYRCKYCGVIVRSSNTRCCATIDPLLSSRSRIHTILSASIERQLEEIVRSNFDEILRIRKQLDATQASVTRTQGCVDAEWADYIDHLKSVLSSPSPTLSIPPQPPPGAATSSSLMPPSQRTSSAVCGRQRRRLHSSTMVEQVPNLCDAPNRPWQLFPTPANSRSTNSPPTSCHQIVDIHQSSSFLEGMESRADRENGQKLHLSLNFCCDGYPMYSRGRGSAVPVVFQLLDLGARSRSKPYNLSLPLLIGGKGKIGAKLWETILPDLKASIDGIKIVVNGYECTFRIVSATIDADCVRELYEFKGWTAYFGCFRCYSPGVRSSRATRFPPTDPPPLDRTSRSILDDATKAMNGFNRFSLIHEFVSMVNIKFDSLHIIDEGVLKDICRGLTDPKSIFYMGQWKEALGDVVITVPSDYVKPRSVTESMLTATEYNIVRHCLTTLVVLSLEDYVGDNATVSILLFAIITCLLYIRKRSLSDADLRTIREMFSQVEKEWLAIGGAKAFTWKTHTLFHHIPRSLHVFGTPDDSSMAPMEAINRQLDLNRNQASSRGYEKRQMTRFLLRSFVRRRLHKSVLDGHEAKQAAIFFPELSINNQVKVDDSTFLTKPIRGKPGFFRTLVLNQHRYTVGDTVALHSNEWGQIQSLEFNTNVVVLTLKKYLTESVIPMLLRVAPRGKFITSFLCTSHQFINSSYCIVYRRNPTREEPIAISELKCKCFRVAFASFHYDILVANDSRYRHE